MKKVKIFIISIMLIIIACTLVGCKSSEKSTEEEWLKNMEKVSYIKLSGYSGEKTLDHELAKIILKTYDKSTDEETLLANENSSMEGNMFYFYDDDNNLLYQVPCNYDGYYGEEICVMEAHKEDGKYKYNYHTFKSKKAVEYINKKVK